LLTTGYRGFAEAALSEREAAAWPPFTYLALLRAEASAMEAPLNFLRAARAKAEHFALPVTLLGPAPAPMQRRAGRFRAQLLLQADTRGPLQSLLRPWVEQLAELPSANKVRWAVDVDPGELF